MNKIKLQLFILFIYFAIGSENSNIQLLNNLSNNKGWELFEITNDSIEISLKSILKSELSAVKVEKIVNLEPSLITDIVMDVENYNSFLTNTETLKSKVIEKNDSSLIALQYINIDMLFFKNREYLFKMVRNSVSNGSSSRLCHWLLLNSDYGDYKLNIDDNVVYLKKGAGIWKYKRINMNQFKISYLLYMDPGGSIPNILVNIINKQSIVSLFRDVLNQAGLIK